MKDESIPQHRGMAVPPVASPVRVSIERINCPRQAFFGISSLSSVISHQDAGRIGHLAERKEPGWLL